eukprot:scaffold194831_cov24-Tisochrysis_lutea.AAC.1
MSRLPFVTGLETHDDFVETTSRPLNWPVAFSVVYESHPLGYERLPETADCIVYLLGSFSFVSLVGNCLITSSLPRKRQNLKPQNCFHLLLCAWTRPPPPPRFVDDAISPSRSSVVKR